MMGRPVCSCVKVLLVTLSLAACAENKPSNTRNFGIFRQKNEGYSILYSLMIDESRVADIFFIKHASDDVGNLVRQIAATAKAAKAKMDDFRKADNRIDYDVQDLPLIEDQSRQAARSEDTKALLGSSGKNFELRLLFTQAQAMMYTHDLCSALLAAEDDPARKTFLSDLANQSEKFYESLLDLLQVKG